MPRPNRRPARKIPAEKIPAIVERSRAVDPATGRPYTQRDIASWLWREHGIRASRMAVCRVLAAQSERGDELIVAALREELRDAVAPTKLALLRGVRALDDALAGEADTTKLASGVRALTGALSTLAKLGGVAAPLAVDVTSGGQPLPDAYALLAAAAARLAEEPDAVAAGEAPHGAPT